MGAVFAKNMGLPIKKLVISTNGNDEFPNYLKTGVYNKIEPSVNCISSAMNVGHPSNIARLVAIYGGVMDEKGNITKQADLEKMRTDIYSVSINDTETRKTIEDAYKEYKLILEPHGSVGWLGLQKYLKDNVDNIDSNQLCVSLETAHPAKFPEEINTILGIDPKLPKSLEGLENKQENMDLMELNYDSFKAYLINKYKK